MTLQRFFTCLVGCLLTVSAAANHRGQLENFFYDKNMDKGMFSYGFEVAPMDSAKPRDLSSGMSFGVRHHRHDDGSQSWGYAIGSGPLPASALQESGSSAATTSRPVATHTPSSSGGGFPVLTARASGPSAPLASPGLFQASGRGFRPVYVRREQLPPQPELLLDGQLQLGSEKVHQVVPFDGDFGARLPRRLQPDESAPRGRGQTRRGGFRRRQQVRYRPRQTEQQPEPEVYPSEQQPKPEVYPSEQQQQQEPPVTTYRPSVRPAVLATALLEEPVSAPGADFGQSAPSAPIRATQVAAAAQPVTEYRGRDGSGPLPGPDPRFQPRPFGAGPLPPGVFPPGVRGGAPFSFDQQGPPFRGNFAAGPSPGINGFPNNFFFGNGNAGPQNNGGFFGNDFAPNSAPSFGDQNNGQLVRTDGNIRTPDQFQNTENAWQGRYPEDNFNQFSGSQQVSDEPPTTVSPLPEDVNRADPSPSADFTDASSEANDVAPVDNDRSTAQSDRGRRRYRGGDSGGPTSSKSTSGRPRILSGGRRPVRRRQRPASDPSPLLSASHTPDTSDEEVFANPDSASGSDGSQSGAGFRRRPSKAIILTAASVYQDDTTERPEPDRVTIGHFVDPLNGTRIVIRRRLKKIPRVSTDETTELPPADVDDQSLPSTTETPLLASLVDDESSQERPNAEPTYSPDRHRGPRPRVLAVGGRRRNRLRPRQKNTSTTETPALGSTLKDVHPVEAPPTRRNRQRSRLEKQSEDDASSRQEAEHSGDEEPIATGEGSDSDAVLARPPTDSLSPLERRKAARQSRRRGQQNNRRRPPGRDTDGNDDDTGSTDDEPESGRPGVRRGNRPGLRRRGRPQRGPGIVRLGLRTTLAPDAKSETTAAPEFTVTTPSGVSDDGETSISTVAVAPTEEPARRRGASQLRRPGLPRGSGRRLWQIQQDDDKEDETRPTVVPDNREDQARPTVAPSPPSEPSTVSRLSYLPTTESGVVLQPTTAQGPSFLPTTESAPTATTYYPPSTAREPSYRPSTEPGPATLPTTGRPRSLMDRYNEDYLATVQEREEALRAQFDRNLASIREPHSDDATKENFRSLFNRRLDEKLGSSPEGSQSTTTQMPMHDDDSDKAPPLDDAASRAAKIQALFARYTKATLPPSSTTATPFPTTTTLDPNSQEARLQALFAQYTEATTTADPTSTTGDDDDLQKLFALHVQTLGTTVPTPVVVENFQSSVSRVGATPSGGAEADRKEDDGWLRNPTRAGYLPQPTTPGPFADSTAADAPPRADTRQPDLNQSQVPSPIGRAGSPASKLRPPSDSSEGQDRGQQQQQGTTNPQRSSAATKRRPSTPPPFREPTTSSDPTQWTLDDILESARPTTRLANPKAGNDVRFSDAPRSTTRRPTRRPEPARPFDGFNGIDDDRHAEKLTLDSDSEQETKTRASAPEQVLPVSSGAQSVIVSLLMVLLSSWLSLTALRLTL